MTDGAGKRKSPASDGVGSALRKLYDDDMSLKVKEETTNNRTWNYKRDYDSSILRTILK